MPCTGLNQTIITSYALKIFSQKQLSGFSLAFKYFSNFKISFQFFKLQQKGQFIIKLHALLLQNYKYSQIFYNTLFPKSIVDTCLVMHHICKHLTGLASCCSNLPVMIFLLGHWLVLNQINRPSHTSVFTVLIFFSYHSIHISIFSYLMFLIFK